ncbi:GNAT family N-acetyltransferase [Caballeronia sp. RCC_10]|uniref:GNAT family N-acetyltransferase n=1 Tax=Caballeronia sp. RCC_10 TaxID=3239227 RepID=UPI0035244726
MDRLLRATLRPEATTAMQSPTSVQFEVLCDIESFRSLEREWTELHERACGEYFQSFNFCHSALVAEDTGSRRKLHCIVGRRDGRVVTIWPLFTVNRSWCTFAEPLTPPNRSPSDILVAPEADRERIVESAWSAAVNTSRADVFELWRVRKTSPLYAIVSGSQAVRRELEDTTPFSRLRAVQDWKLFCRSRPGREKNAPEYLMRRLARHGEFMVEHVEPSDHRLPAFIEWFVAQKRIWAVEKGIPSEWTHSDASLKFWTALLAGEYASSSSFQFFILTLEGKPVAANVLATTGQCAYLVATTYDMRYSKLSPGTVLVDECVGLAFRNGLDFDFGPGEQRYKTSWSAGGGYATSSFIVLSSPRGKAGFVAKQLMNNTRASTARLASQVFPKRRTTMQ